jgi:hypothetical protein
MARTPHQTFTTPLEVVEPEQGARAALPDSAERQAAPTMPASTQSPTGIDSPIDSVLTEEALAVDYDSRHTWALQALKLLEGAIAPAR